MFSIVWIVVVGSARAFSFFFQKIFYDCSAAKAATPDRKNGVRMHSFCHNILFLHRHRLPLLIVVWQRQAIQYPTKCQFGEETQCSVTCSKRCGGVGVSVCSRSSITGRSDCRVYTLYRDVSGRLLDSRMHRFK